MAKALPQKHKNRKLRRTVRRSTAALFMITAIVLAAIPVPDVAADSLINPYSVTKSISYNEITNVGDSEYALPGGTTPIATYEIKAVGNGSAYQLMEVFKIWLKDGKGVICDFNSAYNPANGVLTIPTNVVTQYQSFTTADMNTYLKDMVEADTIIKVNAFFDIPVDSETGKLPDKHYKKNPVSQEWIDPNTALPINEFQKRGLYMHMMWGYGKSYEAREVITETTSSGNVRELFPFNPASGYVQLTDYQINAIGDNAFYDAVNNTGKANHIQNLELQIQGEIVAIGNNAFRGAASLKKVTIGARVMRIGARAFRECTSLNELKIEPGNKEIGVETFYGCNSLTSVSLPNTFEKIDTGAFAFCANLSSVDMSPSSQTTVEIGDFAFYNCPNLNAVKFAPRTTKIGDGCFAVISPMNSLVEIVLPQESQNLKILGKSMFDGQSNLKNVTMPLNFGYEIDDYGVSVLDSGFFYKCRNLEQVIFPEESRYASFPADVFSTVQNPDFRVVGPATLGVSDVNYAKPRESAHAAGVPYQYTENNVVYLELKKGENFYRIDRDNEQLISFESQDDPIDFEIFDKVGSFNITGIAGNCLSEDIKQRLGSVTIHDNSIATIDANTFADCPKLSKVSIGNKVSSIGDNAFLNCPKLEKISFATPSAGHANMTIGNNAFKTNSKRLLLQGDLVKGYAPFTWAMDEANVMDEYGTRVCYKSNAPQNLTVIRDNITGLSTLIDYPHFEDVDKDNKTYKENLILYYQGTVDDPEKKKEIASIISESHYIQNKLRASLGEAPVEGSVFTPTSDPWYKLTTEEQQFYDSIVNVVIPDGIESIDSKTFYDPSVNQAVKSNTNNWPYVDQEKWSKYYEDEDNGPDMPATHGGLFSGKFKEYPALSDKEKYENGNDRLETITMSDVKALPAYAFDSCENLKKVVIGDDVIRMGATPFTGCTTLDDVSGNANFAVENKIVYSNNPDGSRNIVECLPIRGLKNIDEKAISAKSDPSLSEVSSISEGAFRDCAGIADVDLSTARKLTQIPKYCFYNSKELSGVKLPDSIRSIEDGAFQKSNTALSVTIPTKQISIADNGFEHNQGHIITFPDSPAWAYGKRWEIRLTDIGEMFVVKFINHDGTTLDTQTVAAGKDAEPPVVPERKGWKFTGWGGGEYKNVTQDLTLIAQFDPVTDGGGDNGGNNGGNNGNNNGGGNSNSGNNATKEYKVTVTSGSGSGNYKPGVIVNITANASSEAKVFDKWTTTSAGVYFANVSNVTTSFVMPNNDVTVTATYRASSVSTNSGNKTNSGNRSNSGNSSTGNKNNTSNSTSASKTGTVISITKPGFSNTDKANAIVNGSSDNFVVKVTESAEAQAAIQEALLNSSLTMDTIKYFPMDISLYDSTGTVPITDTSGISVTITMPVPDELRLYGGNNKVASVADGQLEELRPKFSTIDQVPCVTFTATHFSPYTIYVDTANLVAGDIQDSNPKTGDGIHPKWFLVIGLMAASAVLFLKKDKKEGAVVIS